MTDLTLKYNLLDTNSRKEVLNFLDFLLTKKGSKTQSKNKSDYKKKLLAVSVWSDIDIDSMNKNQQKFNQWKAQNW